LETLSRKLADEQLRLLKITIFETASHCGAGTVYSPDQPQVLRMNFATQNIDFWKSSVGSHPSQDRSLIAWLCQHYPQWAQSDSYVPRAVVGEYLSDCFDQVVRKFPSSAIQIYRKRVQWIRYHKNGRYEIGTGDGPVEHPFDSVVVTTGHEGLRCSATLSPNQCPARQTFALDGMTEGRTGAAPRGRRTLIRGFGLTAIDAIMRRAEGVPANQLGQIVVHSRTGRPMLAKPTRHCEPMPDSFWTCSRQKLLSCKTQHGAIHFERDIWSVVTETTAELMTRRSIPTKASEVADFFRCWRRDSMDQPTAYRIMAASIAIANGREPTNIAAALGETWRKLYPQLVEAISYGGLANDQWDNFRETATEMERIAFGPPAESLEFVCQLIQRGNISLIRGEDVASHGPFDEVINAVIAGPHQPDPQGPVASLIESNLLQTDRVTGGVMVDEAGSPVAGPQSLAIFGRATEGWVLGNDTLSRTMHSQMERWGERLSARLAVVSRLPIE
jgi:uncharacterized NAD(P)/FAD-binding protein YdhS